MPGPERPTRLGADGGHNGAVQATALGAGAGIAMPATPGAPGATGAPSPGVPDRGRRRRGAGRPGDGDQLTDGPGTRARRQRAAGRRGPDTRTWTFPNDGDDEGEAVDHNPSTGSEAVAVDGAPAPRRRKVGEPVRLPVPITTRAWAFLRLALFVAMLGLIIGGGLVFLVITLGSSLLD